jgi:hypothetical protein
MLFFQLWKFGKNHRWLVTLLEFCPKNLSLYFFNFFNSKNFPKWYHTCMLVCWLLGSNVILKIKILEQILTQNMFFSKIGIFTNKFFFLRNELTCDFRKVQNTIYIFFEQNLETKIFFMFNIFVKIPYDGDFYERRKSTKIKYVFFAFFD